MQRRKHPNYCSWVVFMSQTPEKQKMPASRWSLMVLGNLIESSQNKFSGSETSQKIWVFP